MFRAQQNMFDDVVVKATDENLTSENWEYILDVCDKVGGDANGAKDAVAAMIKRLAHRNANVQLYTLELANALSQNCGLKMHKELASRSFTEAMLRLAGDRNTHHQVKSKILERMAEWTQMFKSDPDLGIMEQAYMRLKTQNPNLHPPSKPQKQQITDSDRKREEEELQMALALSVKEKASQPAAASSNQPKAQAESSATPASTEQRGPIASGTTAATVSRVRALYDFQPSEPGELQFRRGDIIAVLESVYKDWWKGSLRGQEGIFPLNYVEKLQDPTREELEREAQMEAEVFGEIKNVEKLLALLSTNTRPGDVDVRENEEITNLYHSTLAIRPKLIELIGKYSQKKDDFTQLNEKFIKARRDYEALLEASMSHPSQPAYGRPNHGYSGYPPHGYGAPPPPPPQDGRFQSPAPQQYPPQQHAPQQPPPQQQQPPQPHHHPHQQEPPYPMAPPQNGPTPFYMVPPGQQVPPQQRPQQSSVPPGGSPKPNPAVMAPPQSQPPPQNSQPNPGMPPQAAQHQQPPQQAAGLPQRTHSLSYPQELATTQFDSPVDGRQGYPPPSQQPRPNSVYDSPPTNYAAYNPSGPGAGHAQVPSSPQQGGAYPALPGGPQQGSAPPAQGSYVAYNPNMAQGGQAQRWGGGAPSAPPPTNQWGQDGNREAESYYS